MYITRVKLENVRTFERFVWHPPKETPTGWHVILGDNGSGKSTFLRAIALAFSGPAEAHALRQDWNTWLRHESSECLIELEIAQDNEYDFWSEKGRQSKGALKFGLRLAREVGSPSTFSIQSLKTSADPNRHVWGENQGWFSAGFGPFRRFSGGNKDYEKLFYTSPRLARHLSTFGEDVALTEAISWLRDLRFKQLEEKAAGALLPKITAFVNQTGFLPHNAKLTAVDSERVVFKDGNGFEVSVLDLSDGFRSVLSMTFELIRQMSFAYGPDKIFLEDNPCIVSAPGVVLIDEVDVHLHPSWQRRIGPWFRDHFPNVQFIVTTHSPFICQAAEHGSIWKLPAPGLDDEGGPITGTALQRLLFGDILEAFSSGAFGTADRSKSGKDKLHRLAELNLKSQMETLTEEEELQRSELRALFGTQSES
jgi:predicted ATPase